MQWLQNPVLQQQTASEPLTIEEEYEMQAKWQVDEDSKWHHHYASYACRLTQARANFHH